MKIKFSPPDISNLEIEEVIDTLKSGWITTGPKTKLFENMISSYVGASKTVCLNSQTACAELALSVLGVKAGDEVITCAYTYSASASIIAHLGGKIVFVDCDKNAPHIDYQKLENAITEKTKAIIPIDLAGIPCDYDRIFEIVESKKHLFKPTSFLQEKLGRIAVMADTAHSLGATYKGKKIGSVADFSSFSFHAVKNLTTAEGGAVCWRNIDGVDNDDLYKQFQLLSLHGQNKNALDKSNPTNWEYDIVAPNYKCNMTDLAASLGIAQLKRYDSMLARRKEIIKKFDKAFKSTNIEVLEHYTDSYESSGHLYITRVKGVNLIQRNEIIKKMADEGIACNVHYKPLPMMTGYKNLGFDIKNYPNSYNFFENEITLPLHTLLSDEDVDYIIENYKKIVKEYLWKNGKTCHHLCKMMKWNIITIF